MTELATTLVLGGARSGKSAFAERLIRSSALQRIYLATATPGDDEMQARIAHHRTARGDGWTTVEEPLELVPALKRESAKGRAVLVDCLTLWLSNIMHAERDVAAETPRSDRLAAARRAIRSCWCPTTSALAWCRKPRSAAASATPRAVSTRRSPPPFRGSSLSRPGFRSGSRVHPFGRR